MRLASGTVKTKKGAITFENVRKIYPNGVKAVDDFMMEVADGEFVAFVGPSGCGKSTTLRMIAGLKSITGGSIHIGGRPVNNLRQRIEILPWSFRATPSMRRAQAGRRRASFSINRQSVHVFGTESGNRVE